MLSQIEWQKYLDGLFPVGASLTPVKDIPEFLDDSPTFLTPYFKVYHVRDGVPEVGCFLVELWKDSTFYISELEPKQPGIWWVHQPIGPILVLSTVFGPGVKETLVRLRQELYGSVT